MDGITVREYAAKKRITLGTVYRRIWEGNVSATKLYGRWLILTEADLGEKAVASRASSTEPNRMNELASQSVAEKPVEVGR